jgi:hypothetical protein
MHKILMSVMALLFGLVQQAIAQKTIEVRDQTWFGYFNQTRLTNKSGVWVDLHQRFTGSFYEEPAVTLGRVGYIYYLSDNFRLVFGDAFVKHYAHGSGPDIPEHRPWQQLQWIEKKNGFTIVQWLRIEERFRKNVVEGQLTDDYNFNWRFRYNLMLTIPFKGKEITPHNAFAVFNNELHVNAGKEIVNNYFDQDRLFIGLGYQFTKHLNAHLGYLYVFQQLATANQFVQINAIRLFVFQTIDLRREQSN